jgi:enoyl-CoA hydratase/carnithine racemase
MADGQPNGATGPELVTREGDGVLTVVFNRPEQRNAMTWEMYSGLADACTRADDDPAIGVLVLRGAGQDAFVAGTDIGQFTDFDGPRGVDYERQISEVLGRLQSCNVPVLAAIDGYCIGGGLGIAAAADLRICTPGSRFGIPIARTLGNCLSAETLDLLCALLGRSRVVDMIMRARNVGSEEALQGGFVGAVTGDLDGTIEAWTARLLGHAPLTIWALKEALRRLHRESTVDDSDIISTVYGSDDFGNAVEAFLTKSSHTWTGR